jgi:DNA processing protein
MIMDSIMSMHDRLTLLYALRFYGDVGPKTLISLILRYGTLETIMNAEIIGLTGLPRISVEKAVKIIEARQHIDKAVSDIRAIRSAGIGIVSIFDDDYPPALNLIGDPPPILFYRGKPVFGDRPAVAVVGTTKASEDGIAMAVQIGKVLAERGISVISGLATGIDASAHLGALKNNGYTVGVLGCGLLNIYPDENMALARLIQNDGCLLSEFLPEVTVSAGRLLSRNRVIVSLSSAVIAVETSDESGGTLNAVERARKMGIPCYIYDPGRKLSFQAQAEYGFVTFDSIEHFESMIDYMIVDNNPVHRDPKG